MLQSTIINMKKTLSYLGILTLTAGLLSSCSKDEEMNNNVEIQQKKLSRIIVNKTDNIEYKYDSKGKLFSASTYDVKSQNELCWYSLYSFDNDKIVKSIYNQNEDLNKATEYTISMKTNPNGFLIRKEFFRYETIYDYAYDNEGHVIYEIRRVKGVVTDSTAYEWENGNLIKLSLYDIDYPDYNSTTILKYTDNLHPTAISNKGKLNFHELFSFYNYECFLVGVPSKDLPVSVDFGAYEETFEWAMDADGYPTKLTGRVEDNEHYFVFFWE